MSKTILLAAFVICCWIPGFSQKAETSALSDRIFKAFDQKLPGWTFSRNPKLHTSGVVTDPQFEFKIKDTENRQTTVIVNLIESAEAKESRFNSYFTRSIMPPDSSKIENFVEKGFMVGTGRSVDALFSKANLMVSLYTEFPTKPNARNSPSYDFPAPPEEKTRMLKIIQLIADAIDGSVNLDECRNTFFRYRAAASETAENKLLIAVINGDADEVSELLRQNADPNARMTKDLDFGRAADNHGNTALHFAARQGCGETVRALIAAKADVNAVNGQNETPLMAAAYLTNAEAAQLLIGANADVQAESYDSNAAFFAVRAKQNLIAFSLQTERKIQKMSDNARTILKALAAKGLDLKKKEKWNGNTLLTALLSTARGKFAADMAETLLEYGVDPNEANTNGETPLLILADKISIDSAALIKMLVAKGADVNKPDKNNRPPLRVLLGEQSEYRNSVEYSKYINEAIAVLVNAGAKE